MGEHRETAQDVLYDLSVVRGAGPVLIFDSTVALEAFRSPEVLVAISSDQMNVPGEDMLWPFRASFLER